MIVLDQSLMSKNICYKRRDDMATAADDTHALTTTTTPHVIGTPGDQQSVAPAQVSPTHCDIGTKILRF